MKKIYRYPDSGHKNSIFSTGISVTSDMDPPKCARASFKNLTKVCDNNNTIAFLTAGFRFKTCIHVPVPVLNLAVQL